MDLRRTLVTALTLILAACAVAPQPKSGPYHPSDAPVTITRIVHGSYLLDLAGVRLLVDPWYYPRGLVNHSEPLGLTFRSLPTIQGILITHRHGDHLDSKALEALSDHDLPVVVRPGLSKAVRSAGYAHVTELEWWQTTKIADLTIHAVPANHTVDENGYVVERLGATVYVAGDTRYFDGMGDIKRRFPTIDVALIPIGGLRFLGVLSHMRPPDAARAVRILQPRRVIPTHYGAAVPLPIYWTARHPVEDFREALDALGQDGSRLVVIAPGESWHYYPE